MDVQDDPVPTNELLERLSAAGYPTTERQLERWRNAELLMRARPNAFRGSPMRHASDAVAQAIAIHRCLAVKDRFDFAGPLLWAAGFDVGEQYYSKRLETGDRLFRKLKPFSLRAVRKIEALTPDRTIGDAAAVEVKRLTGVLAKMSRRLDDPGKSRFFNVGVEITSGEFDRFDMPATDRETGTSEIIERAFNIEAAKTDHILGSRLRLDEALEGTLKELSEIQGAYRLSDFSWDEILIARDDVRNALKAAICFYNAMAWSYGATAFGLRLLAFIARTAPIPTIFFLIMGFARLRKAGAEIYSSPKIAQMARQAEATWLISTYFFDLLQLRPDLAHLILPKRIKASLSSDIEYGKLLKSLEDYQFPTPEFRPWNSWQKLAKRRMSPGLLVMSIGAPAKLSMEEVQAAANGGR